MESPSAIWSFRIETNLNPSETTLVMLVLSLKHSENNCFPFYVGEPLNYEKILFSIFSQSLFL